MSECMTPISYSEAVQFLIPRHYSGRKPNIKWAFGWFLDGKLVAVCTFGKPASPYLCKGICGDEFKGYVYELNRLCRIDELKIQISRFVSYTLRECSKHDVIVVSYSDTAMNHNGYIYQACNFIYTGKTKYRTDKYVPGGKHARHYKKDAPSNKRLARSEKHRYIYFCSKNKSLKKKWRECLKYPISKYPKGENKNYILGDYIKPVVIHQGEAL